MYVEGVDFAFNHYPCPIFSYFGCNFIDDGDSLNVQNLIGESGTLAEGYQFEYQYGSDSDYQVDEISANEGTLIFTSQDGKGRGVCYDGGEQYHTIFTSTLFGAMIDGESPNTKAELMSSYLAYLTQPFVSTDEHNSLSEFIVVNNYPNPFNPATTISFSVAQTSSFVNLEVFNIKGQKIKTFPVILSSESSLGKGSIVWNGTDDNNQPVSSGIYFYKLKTGDYQKVRKMILLK